MDEFCFREHFLNNSDASGMWRAFQKQPLFVVQGKGFQEPKELSFPVVKVPRGELRGTQRIEEWDYFVGEHDSKVGRWSSEVHQSKFILLGKLPAGLHIVHRATVRNEESAEASDKSFCEKEVPGGEAFVGGRGGKSGV